MKEQKDIISSMAKDNPEFVEVVSSSTDLNAILAQLAADAEEVQMAKEADQDLEEKREAARLAASSYTDAAKAIRAKTKYVLAISKERGAR